MQSQGEGSGAAIYVPGGGGRACAGVEGGMSATLEVLEPWIRKSAAAEARPSAKNSGEESAYNRGRADYESEVQRAREERAYQAGRSGR